MALVGFVALGGRLPVGKGLRAILGAVLILSAPDMASALADYERPAIRMPIAPSSQSFEARGASHPTAQQNPYARASVVED